MKKMIFVLVVLTILLTQQTVKGTLLSSNLPAGKNYIDVENFTQTETSIESIDSIRVKPYTNYVLSFPGTDLIGEVELYVSGNNYYFEDYVTQYNECVVDQNQTYCTFQTQEDQYIDIYLFGNMMGLFINYYGFINFQLEEGVLPTMYEEYIAPLIDSTSPEFSSSGAYITSYFDTTSIADIVAEHVYAIDEVDGDISNKIIIIEDYYTGFTGVTGEYDVLLEVEDTAGNSAMFNLVIIVKDEVIPTIIGPDIIQVNIDNQYDVNSLLTSNYQFIDEYDGEIMYTILNDQYTVNMQNLGVYDVTIEIIDSSLNRIERTVQFEVVDQTAPVLLSNSTITTDVDNLQAVNDILNSLSYIDNVDDTVDLILLTDGYTGNEHIIGTYFIDIELKDDSLNSKFITLSIDVQDNVNPIITGPSEIDVSYTEHHSIQTLIDLFIYSDNNTVISENHISIVNDNYSSAYDIVGQYHITIEVIDDSGNSTSHILMINVKDDQAPVIFIDEYIVKIQPSVSFTKEDALLLMYRSSLLEEDTYELDILINEYKGNETEPGMYMYQVQFTSSDGKEVVKDFVIEVVDNDVKDYSSIVQTTFLLLAFMSYIVIKKRK